MSEHLKITQELRLMQRTKFKELFKFIGQNSELAEQGSPEWLAMRKGIIGGSELSTILGKNPFNKIPNLVADKIGLTKFHGNIATRWGRLFEELSRIIMEMILIDKTSQSKFDNNQYGIFETGSLEGAIPHHRFSPDGLSVFLYKCGRKSLLQFLITLLEFKSPLRSIPSGVVPEYYAPQIQAGLCDIDISEIGLFVNNMFRKCSLSDLGLSTAYDTVFHMSDLDIKKKFKPETPVAYGVIGFYQTSEQSKKYENYINKSISSYLNKEADASNASSDEDVVIDDLDNGNLDINGLNISLARQAIIANNKYDSDNSDENDSDSEEENWIHKNIDDKIQNLKIKNNTSNTVSSIEKFLIDFGEESSKNMDILLKYLEMDFISVEYYDPNINIEKYIEYLPSELVNVTEINKEANLISYKLLQTDPIKFIKKFAKTCKKNKYIPIGYLPWKLFRSDIIVVEKDPLYIYQFVDKIEEVIKIIEDINTFDTTEEQIERYKYYFPRSKIN